MRRLLPVLIALAACTASPSEPEGLEGLRPDARGSYRYEAPLSGSAAARWEGTLEITVMDSKTGVFTGEYRVEWVDEDGTRGEPYRWTVAGTSSVDGLVEWHFDVGWVHRGRLKEGRIDGNWKREADMDLPLQTGTFSAVARSSAAATPGSHR